MSATSSRNSDLATRFTVAWNLAGGARLAWIIEADLARCEFDGRAAGEPVAFTRLEDCDLLHIDAGAALSLTLRTGPHPAVIYARTNQLAALGIAGGRYGSPELV